MNTIAAIKEPVKTEMQDFEKAFVSSLYTDNPLLSSVNNYVLKGSGKKLRPILVMLAAKICGTVNEATILSAISLELLHTASLIHDDVVDDTNERRGKESINAKWTNKISILSGDYMLSTALYYATKTQIMGVLELISNIGRQLSDGELLQLSNSDQIKTTEENYLKIIRKKTALLFSTCTEIGALSVNATSEQRKALRCYGEYLGICFQMKDDIFDYFEDASIGKPTGNDIRDGKLTLPLIYALRNTSGEHKEQIISWIKDKDFTEEHIHDILKFARDNNGIHYTQEQMTIYKNKAIAELDIFPDSDIKKALVQCAEFVMDRIN